MMMIALFQRISNPNRTSDLTWNKAFLNIRNEFIYLFRSERSQQWKCLILLILNISVKWKH